MHLGEKFRYRIEVMGRDAAGDEVEALVLERKRLRFGIGGANVGEAALGRFALHHVEHFLSYVGRPHTRDMWSESISNVAATGGDVQCMPVLFRRGEGDQALQALSGRVRLAGQIVSGSLAELLLDSCFGHGVAFRWVVRRTIYPRPTKSPASFDAGLVCAYARPLTSRSFL